MNTTLQIDERLDNFRKKAIEAYHQNNGLRYSFTQFEGVYAELTYHIVNHILAEQDMQFLSNVLMTLLRECISNAVKANLKRAWFKKHAADIADETEYAEYIQRFKAEAVSRIEEHLDEMKSSGLQVHLIFDVRGDKIRFSIENNTPMTATELARVRERIDAAARIHSMAEAMERFADDQEGAGLGLLINIMLLRKSGIGPENFRIASDEQRTRVSITIPRTIKLPSEIHNLMDQVMNEIGNIPTFPETIRKVIELCENPDSNTDRIVQEIEKDPSLATNILRLANSGGFVAGNHIHSIKHGVAIIGIQNLRQLAMAMSSREILSHQYRTFAHFWQHAEKCATYARLLARELGFGKRSDTVYLGGLLHDLGKILLLAIEPAKVEQINGIRLGRTENSTSTLEEITLGMSHSQVGARLAAHWQFPEEIENIIRFHHSVYASPRDYIIEVSLVHLADALIQTEDRRISYVYYDETSLDRLGIVDHEALENLHQRIKSQYELLQARQSNQA
ncbi:MAG: HDOD domain-containing protein [Leptospiraceae bacterium]|nr:HDOD domain-containing protein [Leptospiraceae bacterium]